MFGIIFGLLLILGCLWISITSVIVAYRRRERALLILAASTGLFGLSQSIPLTNLLIGGFGDQMEFWLVVQLGILLLALVGLATFSIPFGGLSRLRTTGLLLKHILLLRTP